MSARIHLDDTGTYAAWSVRRNCTWAREFVAKLDGSPMNLTGYTVTAEVSASEDNATALRTFSCSVTNAAQGRFRVEIAEANADLAAGRYWWSLQWSVGGISVPLCAGPFIVRHWGL
jgi:hypothetical protein